MPDCHASYVSQGSTEQRKALLERNEEDKSDECSADAKKEMTVHKNWNPHAPIGLGVPKEDQAPMRTKAISSTKKQTAEANVVYIQFPDGCATGAHTTLPRCRCHCARNSHDSPSVGVPSQGCWAGSMYFCGPLQGSMSSSVVRQKEHPSTAS